MSVGTNIKKRRYELNMSQQELADALGYKTRSTIAKIESGENDINQKKLQRIAEILDTTVTALIEGMEGINENNTQNEKSIVAGCNAYGRQNRTAAIILAGGKSIRNNQNIPNQFINVLGKPVIVYCLEAYEAHPAIDDIYIVCLRGWEKIVTAYAGQYHISKLRSLIPAAATGILSVQSGLEYIQDKYDDNDIVIFQESTRPMISVDMISKLLQSCYEYGAANICQSMKDYVLFSCSDNKVTYIKRNSVVSLQSPDAYRFKIIKDVFKTAKNQHRSLTESCCAMLLYNLGYKINFIEGSVNNIKIVRQEDIAIFTSLIEDL